MFIPLHKLLAIYDFLKVKTRKFFFFKLKSNFPSLKLVKHFSAQFLKAHLTITQNIYFSNDFVLFVFNNFKL